jgi:hypothetical protein
VATLANGPTSKRLKQAQRSSRQLPLKEKPGSDDETSEPGIFAELVSISSARSANVSDSAYFIESIELRPTFDLFLGARRGLHLLERTPSAETLIALWLCHSLRPIDLRGGVFTGAAAVMAQVEMQG